MEISSELQQVEEMANNDAAHHDAYANDKRIRSVELVDELLEKANLNAGDLMPLVQNVYLTKTIAADDLTLMQLDEAKLQYLLEGNSLVLRGTESDNAMCCTSNATFSFKVAEISNPLLISPDLAMPKTIDPHSARQMRQVSISFMSNSYFVLEKDRPKLQKLRNLLEMNLYVGKSADENDAKKYTMNDILDTIQASEEEVQQYLQLIEAYKIEGYWRLLDYKYHMEVMDNVLKLMDERSWPCDHIPTKEIVNELKSIYSLSILSQFINYYFTPRTDSYTLHEINKEKVCHFYAEALLKRTLKMRYAEFVTILKKSLPANFNYEFNISHIQDICYVDEPYVFYLNALDLPDEIDKRFKYLFEKRKRWSYDELRAYIKDICCNDPIEINNALTKFCRPFTQNNIKYFSSRV